MGKEKFYGNAALPFRIQLGCQCDYPEFSAEIIIIKRRNHHLEDIGLNSSMKFRSVGNHTGLTLWLLKTQKKFCVKRMGGISFFVFVFLRSHGRVG